MEMKLERAKSSAEGTKGDEVKKNRLSDLEMVHFGLVDSEVLNLNFSL